MNHFKKLRLINLFLIQLGLKLHWFRKLHFAITSKCLSVPPLQALKSIAVSHTHLINVLDP